MKEALLHRQIAALREHLDEIVRRAGKPAETHRGLVDEALEELSTSLEELQVADEELRQQNEELHAARTAIEEERRRYQELFEFAPDGYVVMDPKGVVQEANQTAAAMLGVRADFLVGKPLAVYVAEKQRRTFRTHLALAAAGKYRKTVLWDSILRPRHGAAFPAALTMAAAGGADGQPTALRLLFRDITWRHQAEEMQRLNVRLEARVAARTTELADANTALQKEVTDRKRLAVEVVRVSETERQRIGQDLHDSLGQNLTGLAFLSANLQRELASKRLVASEQAAFITGRLNEAVSATRALARGLCPVVLKPEELCTSLEQLAADASATFLIRCHASCPTPIALADRATAIHLYRIAQEAVSNAVRHGRARHVTITLAIRKKVLRLIVEDDGVGMPRQRRGAQGMGLHIMSYRSKTIGGSLDIRKRPGGGTRITCTLPAAEAKA